MKIIFLDIDGVLNTDRQIRINKLEQNENIRFDPIAMKHLNSIIDETNAKIVITSTWKIHREKNGYLWQELLRNLEIYNLDDAILDITPVIDPSKQTELREQEILQWLNTYENIEGFVILDDQWSMGELNHCFIRCLPYAGITKEVADKAILRLKQ
jgi:hypothetical protein